VGTPKNDRGVYSREPGDKNKSRSRKGKVSRAARNKHMELAGNDLVGGRGDFMLSGKGRITGKGVEENQKGVMCAKKCK